MRIMPLLKILHYPEPLLKQKSLPVTEFNDELRQLAEDMAENKDRRSDGEG